MATAKDSRIITHITMLAPRFVPFVAALAIVATGCGNGKPAADPSSEEGKTEQGESEGSEHSGGSSSGGANTATTKPTKGGRVNEKGERSLNTYDKEQTDVVLARAARQVKQNCGATKDENGVATGPWGKVTVKVTLGHNGHSRGTTVPAPYDGKPVGRCIAQAFSNLTIPPWAGDDTDVDWEVELVKPEAAPTPAKGK
ncbi:MAG: hypothetical protein U0174_19795 [Polyangiaceae bacterium]